MIVQLVRPVLVVPVNHHQIAVIVRNLELLKNERRMNVRSRRMETRGRRRKIRRN